VTSTTLGHMNRLQIRPPPSVIDTSGVFLCLFLFRPFVASLPTRRMRQMGFQPRGCFRSGFVFAVIRPPVGAGMGSLETRARINRFCPPLIFLRSLWMYIVVRAETSSFCVTLSSHAVLFFQVFLSQVRSRTGPSETFLMPPSLPPTPFHFRS